MEDIFFSLSSLSPFGLLQTQAFDGLWVRIKRRLFSKQSLIHILISEKIIASKIQKQYKGPAKHPTGYSHYLIFMNPPHTGFDSKKKCIYPTYEPYSTGFNGLAYSFSLNKYKLAFSWKQFQRAWLSCFVQKTSN